MRSWLLLAYLISIIEEGVQTYALPSGKVIDVCLPQFTHQDSYLIIDNHKYFWNEKKYTPNASRPIVCSGPIESSFKIFSHIFLLDDDNKDIPLYEKLNCRTRPTTFYYDCEAEEYCCNGQCCTFWGGLTNSSWFILLMMTIIFCCYLICALICQNIWKRLKKALRPRIESFLSARRNNRNETVAAAQLRQPISSIVTPLERSEARRPMIQSSSNARRSNRNETVAADQLRQPISSTNALRTDLFEAIVADRLSQIRRREQALPTIRFSNDATIEDLTDQLRQLRELYALIVADRLSQITPSTSQPLSSPSTSISVLSEDLHDPTDEGPPPSYEEVTSSKR